MTDDAISAQWEADCLHWRKRVLTGRHRHWCYEWDELPIDETCPEWPCGCAKLSFEGVVQSAPIERKPE